MQKKKKKNQQFVVIQRDM